MLHSVMTSAKYTFKVSACGCSNVGKTSLLTVMMSKPFGSHAKSTIGSDFYGKEFNVSGETCRVQLWDTAGQEQFAEVSNISFRGSDAIIGVYDITDAKTYGDNFWSKVSHAVEVANTGSSGQVVPYVYIVGNKLDLADSQRQVSAEEVRALCDSKGYAFAETSAKDAGVVMRLLSNILNDLITITRRARQQKQLAHPDSEQPLNANRQGRSITLVDPGNGKKSRSGPGTSASANGKQTESGGAPSASAESSCSC